jgi:hypothetical protein
MMQSLVQDSSSGGVLSLLGRRGDSAFCAAAVVEFSQLPATQRLTEILRLQNNDSMMFGHTRFGALAD